MIACYECGNWEGSDVAKGVGYCCVTGNTIEREDAQIATCPTFIAVDTGPPQPVRGGYGWDGSYWHSGAYWYTWT